MKQPRRNDALIPLLTVLTDLVAILGAFAVAFSLRFTGPFAQFFPVTKGYPPLSAYMLGALIVAPVWMFFFNARQVYRARRQVDFTTEFISIVKTVSFGMLVVMSMAFFYREFSYSRLVFIVLWAVAIPLIFTGRILVLSYEHALYRRGKELRTVIIAGTNQTAQNLALRIVQRRAYGYRLAGYIAPPEEHIDSVDIPRLGSLEDTAALVDEHRVETLIVCLPPSHTEELNVLLDGLIGRSVQILLQPEMLGITPLRLRLFDLFGIPFLGIKDIPMTTWSRVAKRTFDVVFSVFVLLITAPVTGCIALLIRLESGLPILYRQTRIGLHGEEFLLLKFRTMIVNAESESGPTWTKKQDPRITRLGRFLRRFSLDELPQFINVLKGEMSVVGPRPERPEFVAHFKGYVPKYLERHRLKTGLTGWAQVNGLRGEVPIIERTKYDLYYIENWSLKLDFRIILKTLRTVLFGKDAY